MAELLIGLPQVMQYAGWAGWLGAEPMMSGLDLDSQAEGEDHGGDNGCFTVWDAHADPGSLPDD